MVIEKEPLDRLLAARDGQVAGAAHKKDKVPAWLDTALDLPFSSCSWLDAVSFFAKLTRRRLKHGVFHSVVALQAAINASSANTMQRILKHSSGKSTPMTSSPPATAGSKRWNQSTTVDVVEHETR